MVLVTECEPVAERMVGSCSPSTHGQVMGPRLKSRLFLSDLDPVYKNFGFGSLFGRIRIRALKAFVFRTRFFLSNLYMYLKKHFGISFFV